MDIVLHCVLFSSRFNFKGSNGWIAEQKLRRSTSVTSVILLTLAVHQRVPAAVVQTKAREIPRAFGVAGGKKKKKICNLGHEKDDNKAPRNIWHPRLSCSPMAFGLFTLLHYTSTLCLTHYICDPGANILNLREAGWVSLGGGGWIFFTMPIS